MVQARHTDLVDEICMVRAENKDLVDEICMPRLGKVTLLLVRDKHPKNIPKSALVLKR
jgi:phage tail protein X